MSFKDNIDKAVKSFAMANLMDFMINDLKTGKGFDVNSIKKSIDSKMKKGFGDSWMNLPVTSPKLLALSLLLEKTLGSRGISPKSIADSALKASQNFDLDGKTKDLLEKIKSSDAFNMESINGFVSDLGDQAKGFVESIDTDTLKDKFSATKDHVIKDMGKGVSDAKEIGKNFSTNFSKKFGKSKTEEEES